MAVPRPVDVGFAEFVSTLLSETLDSIVASQTDQERRRQAFFRAAELDLEDFATAYVTDEELVQALVDLLPDGQGGTALAVGAAPPSDDTLAELDVALRSGDLDESGRLTAQGVRRVEGGVRLLVAAQRRAALQDAVHRGLPRVLVDQGRVAARLTFQTVSTADEGGDEEDTPPPQVLAARPLASGAVRGIVDLPAARLASAIPTAIRDLRLQVRPAGAQDTSDTARASVFGEVELTFRTEA